MTAVDWTLFDIFKVWMDEQDGSNRPTFLGSALNGKESIAIDDDLICEFCSLGVLEQAVMDFWPSYKRDSSVVSDALPGQ